MVHCWGYYEKEKTEMVIYYRAADADILLWALQISSDGPQCFSIKKNTISNLFCLLLLLTIKHQSSKETYNNFNPFSPVRSSIYATLA